MWTRLVDARARARKRWALTGMYTFFLIAGLWAYAYPSQTVLSALQTGLTYLWATFLFLGAGLSLVGRLRGRVGGELVGIPLLSSSNVIFAVALFGFANTAAGFSFGCIFFGLGIGLLDRWTYLRKLLRAPIEPEGINGP